MQPPVRQANIDVVIPVWNDAKALARNLPVLLEEWSPDSIWVVDGGSRDESADVAKKHGVHFLQLSRPGRSMQMNRGAAACGAEIILFLHADTRLPAGARSRIADTISNGAVGGAFARRFDSRSCFLRITCHVADWRGRWFGAFLGDQAIFSTRRAFREVGGFPEQPLFEDFEFSRRLSHAGRTVLLQPPVISSGRRFEGKGALRQTLADFALTIRYLRHGPKILEEQGETQRNEYELNLPPAILVFLKAPVPGQVKTRLAKGVGDERACGIYRQLVERQLANLPKDWPLEVHFSPAPARSALVEWLGGSYDFFSQSEGDLGLRLRMATEAAFARGHRMVILIGGDCPSLNADTLEETARMLRHEADVVIGPATDGGYYLLGLARPAGSLFERIPWSTENVAGLTAERARAAGLRVKWLDRKEDVDDLAAYRRALAAGYLKELPLRL